MWYNKTTSEEMKLENYNFWFDDPEINITGFSQKQIYGHKDFLVL